MRAHSESGGQRLSRRDLGRFLAGSMAGAMMAMAAESKGTAPPEPPLAAAGEETVDTRLTLIEKSRGKALTPEQRKAVLENIKNSDDGWAKGREFPVPDGVEPGFVFHPTPLDDRRAKEKPHGR